jgi:peptidoglycan/xylan/chitin deacetylase (PgdA/CDA1 family)
MTRPLPRRAALAAAVALLSAAVLLPPGAARAAAPPPAPPLHQDAAEGTSALDLQAARFGQAGRDVQLELQTVAPFMKTVLRPGSGRSLCVVVRIGEDPARSERLCVVSDATAPSGLRLRLTRLTADGRPGAITTLPVAVARPDGRTVTAVIPSAKLHLTVGRHDWQAVSHWQDATTCAPVTPDVSPCEDRLPDNGAIPLRIAPLKVVGCAFRGTREVRHGSGRRVALTFDDGPAAITAQFLDVLEREHVPATFFVLGGQVAGRAPLLRRMLADGDMIGNHSFSHALLSGGGPVAASELRRTQQAITQATGFTPCLFRPPYGGTSAALVAAAAQQHLTSVLWDVDPYDWKSPGAGAITATILRQAHAGSIVLSHDGGGPRGQTLAALPAVIHELKRRGYRFVTVTELLGLDLIRR